MKPGFEFTSAISEAVAAPRRAAAGRTLDQGETANFDAMVASRAAEGPSTRTEAPAARRPAPSREAAEPAKAPVEPETTDRPQGRSAAEEASAAAAAPPAQPPGQAPAHEAGAQPEGKEEKQAPGGDNESEGLSTELMGAAAAQGAQAPAIPLPMMMQGAGLTQGAFEGAAQAAPASQPGPGGPQAATAPAAAATGKTSATSAPARAAALPQAAMQVIRAVHIAHKDGTHTVRLALNPPKLGEVRLEFTMKDNVLHVAVQTDTTASRDLLQSHLDGIRARLEEMGITVGGFTVDFGLAPGRDGPGTPESSGVRAFASFAQGEEGESIEALERVRYASTAMFDVLV